MVVTTDDHYSVIDWSINNFDQWQCRRTIYLYSFLND